MFNQINRQDCEINREMREQERERKTENWMTVIREYRSGYRSVEVAWGGSQRQCWFRQINTSVRLSAFHGLLHEMSIVLRARPTLPTMLSDKDIRDDCCALLQEHQY